MNKKLQKIIERGSLPVHVDAARCVKKWLWRKTRDLSAVEIAGKILVAGTFAAAPVGVMCSLAHHEAAVERQVDEGRYRMRLEGICEPHDDLETRYSHVEQTMTEHPVEKGAALGAKLHKQKFHPDTTQTKAPAKNSFLQLPF